MPSASRPALYTIVVGVSLLTAAGLQACEISDIDPMTAKIYGAVRSLSIGVAKDCARYDPKIPTVMNVHQFDDQQGRDAMVGGLQDLRFRALQGVYRAIESGRVEFFTYVIKERQRGPPLQSSTSGSAAAVLASA